MASAAAVASLYVQNHTASDGQLWQRVRSFRALEREHVVSFRRVVRLVFGLPAMEEVPAAIVGDGAFVLRGGGGVVHAGADAASHAVAPPLTSKVRVPSILHQTDDIKIAAWTVGRSRTVI